jgi:hypothetical protein
MREELYRAIEKMINDTQPTKAIDKARAKLKEDFEKVYQKAFLASDLEVLRRHELTGKRQNFSIQCENEDGSTYVDQINIAALFDLSEELEDYWEDYKDGFEVPRTKNGNLLDKVLLLNKAQTKTLKAYRGAQDEWKRATKERYNTFRSVILGARTYEEVLKVIPILGKFKFTSRHNLPAVLTEETLKGGGLT